MQGEYDRWKYRNPPGIFGTGTCLLYHTVSCTGTYLFYVSLPCSLSGNILPRHFPVPDLAQAGVRCRKNARPVRNFSNGVSLMVKNKHTKAGILPAKRGAGPVDRAAGLVRFWEPEERACHRADCRDILRSKDFDLVRVKADLPLFTGNGEPDPEPRGTDPLFYPDNLPYVTAAFPALLTSEYHAGSISNQTLYRKKALMWRNCRMPGCCPKGRIFP